MLAVRELPHDFSHHVEVTAQVCIACDHISYRSVWCAESGDWHNTATVTLLLKT